MTGAGAAGDGPAGAGAAGDGPAVRLTERVEDGTVRPMLVWDAGPGWRMISSGAVGGGIGERTWWLNAAVARDYARTDLRAHLAELAELAGVEGPGVGMLTAADVRSWARAEDGGVHVAATVGLGVPVPAAAAPERIADEVLTTVGTINVLIVLPVPLTDAALVNAVLTATEAKTQALVEHGIPGTGTSSDAICIACPAPGMVPGTAPGAGPGTAPEVVSGPVPGTVPGPVPGPGTTEAGVEPFGGPRSTWGARLARAVHRAVGDGTAAWLDRHPSGDPHRRWPPTWPPTWPPPV